MNLQDLRDELATRATSADQHSGDLLPGVRQKIRRTKQRRTFTALGVVAVLAAVAAGLVPNLSPTPPADTPPEDYTRDGLTVPGTVGSDKLLKAWIGDRGQSSLTFAWTPTTNSITFHADCEAAGGMSTIRFRINGWYVGDASCGTGPEAWAMASGVTFAPDSAFWLVSPVGKPAQVSAELIDLETQRPVGKDSRIWFGIYSTPSEPPSSNGAPARMAPVDAGAYQKDGVVYRKTVGGDTLAAAKVADPGRNEVRFSFTATGVKLVLHDFCTANAGSAGDNLPYTVEMRVGPGQPFKSTCEASSTDAVKGSSLTIASPVPAGQRVDVVATVMPTHGVRPPIPPDVRLGLGVYFQGTQRVIDGMELPEQTEVAGYRYRLAEVKTAPGPDRRLATDTPADQPYVVAYGGSPLGTGGGFRASLTVGKTETGVGVASDAGGMGIGWDAHGAGPSERATLTIAEGKPTKGTLILAIYLPD
ncbi:hypothetical protein EV649_3881 [Kribbella sp. VKM Ac-2569]|uniref:hypothetical protein n=1 Tax=Kribbella sp. VKM Ac-2569 TaxID=2512220 RepID=UPI00102C7E53|nr:hypothetical protein [Kribbella sp. VKM Ac-2569]RZT20729.1 hypothetical protein EV649_3881 [Kribbella sp. VKM Ac-2569]